MFYELIYTRCRKGLDILKHGQPDEKDGFKVYACSAELLSGDIADLSFLDNVAHSKQSFQDPSFMEDAYLYYTPDKGKCIFENFHPIPYDNNATGDYSHRSGNHINHIYVGDFHEFYPYELFGNQNVWSAQTRDERYYYDNPPTPLPPKSTFDDNAGSIFQDDIAKFISDGRQEALSAAVAFLISQYSLPCERRKYLVIQDESTENIELWIAAIENAFSPKMASALPFATRLDKFVTTNLYTVNQNGQFQPSINLQDPNQHPRFRAMIVGVDEHDRNNYNAVRQMPNLPYVVLKGKEKTFMGEVDTTHSYYKAITLFNEHHARFCRRFLQMTDLKAPHEDVMKLYEAYAVLDTMSESTPASMIASALSILGRFNLKNCNYLKSLYEKLKTKLHNFLCENLSAAFSIITWLQKTSAIVGDLQASQSFDRIVNEAFTQHLFAKPQAVETVNFWNSIRSSAFFNTVAATVTNAETLSHYNEMITAFKPENWIAFLDVYLPCAQKLFKNSENELSGIIRRGLYSCYNHLDTAGALQICGLVNKYTGSTLKPLLLSIAESSDNSFNSFCISLLLQASAELTANDANALQFCKELQTKGLDQVCITVLQLRAEKLQNAVDQERFLNALMQDSSLARLDLAAVFTTLDGSIALFDKGSYRIAEILQRYKPKNAICINSAHICADALFNSKKGPYDINKNLYEFARQGFPSIKNENYADKLVKSIFSWELEPDELSYIIELFANSTFYCERLVLYILSTATPKRQYEWSTLLYVMAKKPNFTLRDTIISKILEFKQPGKLLSRLEESISEPSLIPHFDEIAAIVDEELERNQPQSKLGKLFGFMSKKNK